MTDLNVYQRFSDACKTIGQQPWAKNLSNSQFSSIPIDDMRRGVREACIKAGLVHVGPYDISSKRSPKGERMDLIEGSCRFLYVNIDKPDESIEFESLGEAMDTGDKGTGKFITNLIKNHYKAAFDIGEQGKDDIDSYSNEEMYAEAESIKQRKANAQPDKFFGCPSKPVAKPSPKPEEKVSEFISADKLPPIAAYNEIPPESELANYINVKGAMPKFKETVKAYKVDKGAKTAYDLSYDEKVELYDIITAMEEVS